MLRNFGISLLFLALLAAGVDGFRVHGRVQDPTTSGGTNTTSGTTDTDSGQVHTAEFGITPPK